jgi:hypothetical protein
MLLAVAAVGADTVVGEPVSRERVAFGRVVVEGVLSLGPNADGRGGGVRGAEEGLLVLVAGEGGPGRRAAGAAGR